MTDAEIIQESGPDEAIDAEFELAEDSRDRRAARTSGPGWLAYGGAVLLGLIAVGLSAFSFMQSLSADEADPGLEALQAELDNVQAELEAATAARAALSEESSARASETETLLSDVSQIERDIEDLGERFTEQGEELASILAVSAESEGANPLVLGPIERRLTQLEKGLATFSTTPMEADESEQALADIETELAQLEAAFEEFQARLSTLEQESEVIKADVASEAAEQSKLQSAALALSTIEAAARRGEPFLTAHQELRRALPDHQSVEALAPLAIMSLPSLNDLQDQFSSLKNAALDTAAREAGGTQSLLRTLFGDGVQVRQKGETHISVQLEVIETALEEADLKTAIAGVEALDPVVQPIFTDWLENAQNRQTLEESLESLRLTLIAKDRL